MERSVKYDEISEWNASLGFFLTSMPLVRYLAVHAGVGLEQGLVLVADDNQQADQFSEYLAHHFEYIVKLKKPKQLETMRNYMLGIMSAGRKNIDSLLEFLHEDSFLPVVIFGGCVPEELRTNTYILRVSKEDINKMKDEKILRNTQKMQKYILENGQEIFELIKKIISLKESKNKYENWQNFYLNMLICGHILYNLMPEQYDKTIRKTVFNEYMATSEKWINQMSEFAGGISIEKSVSEAFWGYLKNSDSNVWFANRDNLTEVNKQMVELKQCIVYDDEFYYCPESLLASICRELMEICSLREVKQRLSEKGILHSDQSADYTSKITLKFPSESKRVRMLKLDKSYFISDKNEFPEQVIQQKAYKTKKNIIRVYHRWDIDK